MKAPTLIHYTLTSASLFLVSGGLVVASEQDRQRSEKPNIIFVLADDLGYSELGCYGNTFNETPHLDRLAEEGVLFTQSYAAAPVCSPYRVAFLTGKHPARTGITDYLRPDSDEFLDTTLVTLAKAMKLHGYHTGITGKWHLSGYVGAGASVEALPDKHGFDEVMSSETAGIAACSFFYPYHFNTTLEKKLDTEHEFLVDRMNLEAIEFIERNHDKPFFLFVSHYAVHTILHGRPDIVDHFRSKAGSGRSRASANNPLNDPYTKWPADHAAQKNNPHLAAQLWSIDEGIGMIREKLKDLGIEDNTILIFTSDNGGEDRVTSNAPLREGKSTLYEGGIRVPFIACQPQKIAGGLVIDTPNSNYDLYPTLLELTNSPHAVTHTLDGMSIAPLLAGNTRTIDYSRPLFWHYPLESRHFLGGRSSAAIRVGNWKLIEFFDTGERELYNLKEDIGETTDLRLSRPDKLDKLQKLLINWRAEVLP